ncbi:hypothetical protein GOBAR_DD17112 [Gossypium barbadense]|nr:hypothetical protein GOBAR_DD17112 [Gossypium barbadense]
MEPSSTPPSHRSNPISHTKSASRLARIGYSVVESGEQERPTIPHLSLDHISPSPKKLTTPASPSPLSLRSSTNSLPLQELLLLSPASPLRRSRTRLADRLEMAEEVGAAELGGGSRRKCKSRASQTEADDCEKCNLDRMGEMISDLMNEFKLKEEDFLRLAKLILPATNFAISKMRKLFSGEPSMTLKVIHQSSNVIPRLMVRMMMITKWEKVAPLLLLGAEYGHIITLRRLCAFGFFISFSVPKLYSRYAGLINKKAEYMKEWGMETWGACSHKKLVAASAATAFWNLSSIKTRIFTAFITMVIIRYCRQHLVQDSVEVEAEEVEQELSQKALVVAGEESKKN